MFPYVYLGLKVQKASVCFSEHDPTGSHPVLFFAWLALTVVVCFFIPFSSTASPAILPTMTVASVDNPW